MKDEELRKHCKRFVQRGLEFVHRKLRLSEGSLPSKNILKVEFKDRYGYRTRTEEAPDLFAFLFWIKEITNSKAIRDLIQYILDKRDIRSLYTEWEITQHACMHADQRYRSC